MEGWVGKQTMAVTLYAFKLSNLIQLVVIILTSRFLCVFFFYRIYLSDLNIGQ